MTPLESAFKKVLEFAAQRTIVFQLNSDPFASEIEEISSFDWAITFESEWITEEI